MSQNTHINLIQQDKTLLNSIPALLPDLVELCIFGGSVGVTEWARESEQSNGKSS